MKAASEKELVAIFNDAYKFYRGYSFAYEYPGFFAYHQLGTDLSVFFTPDFEEVGVIGIQVNTNSGQHVLDTADVPYKSPLIAPELFAAVLPYLDKHARF